MEGTPSLGTGRDRAKPKKLRGCNRLSRADDLFRRRHYCPSSFLHSQPTCPFILGVRQRTVSRLLMVWARLGLSEDLGDDVLKTVGRKSGAKDRHCGFAVRIVTIA